MNQEEATELVMTAMGEASGCWDNLEGAGVFQSEKAEDVGERLLMDLGFMPRPAVDLPDELCKPA